MGATRRFLVHKDVSGSWLPEFAAQQEAEFAACPAAADISDEEAEDFLLAAMMFDWADVQDLARGLRGAGIQHPPELTYDPYRLGRYLFKRWGDLPLRLAYLERVVQPEPRSTAALRRSRKLADAMGLIKQFRPAAGLAALRRCGVADLVPVVKDAFTPKEQAQYEALLLYGKLRMHRFTTEPEPARTPTHWEQQKVIRQLRHRDVQVRSLNRNLRHLQGERMTLLHRLREHQTVDEPKLRRQADDLRSLRDELRLAETQHAEALARLEQEHAVQVTTLRAQAAGARAAYAETINLRSRLLGGGNAHEA